MFLVGKFGLAVVYFSGSGVLVACVVVWVVWCVLLNIKKEIKSLYSLNKEIKSWVK